MPYIAEYAKRRIDRSKKGQLSSPGELTYALYKAAIDSYTTDYTPGLLLTLVKRYTMRRRVCYDLYATVLGCITSTQLELDRQQDKHWLADVIDYIDILEDFKKKYYAEFVAPYEDTKIAQNGDVLPS